MEVQKSNEKIFGHGEITACGDRGDDNRKVSGGRGRIFIQTFNIVKLNVTIFAPGGLYKYLLIFFIINSFFHYLINIS